MENDTEDLIKAVRADSLEIAPISRPVSIGDILRTGFGTPWRTAVIIVAAITIIVSSLFVWKLIIGPTLFPPMKSELSASVPFDDTATGLAPSLEKPFRCSPNFPFRNNVSKQVEHECKQ